MRNMEHDGTKEGNIVGLSTLGMVLRIIFLAVVALIAVCLVLSSGEDKAMSSITAMFWAAILLVMVATMALFSAWFRRNV